MARQRPVILFDGVCNLCNSAVQWVIEHDEEGRFDFASLQSDAARQELMKVLDANEIDTLCLDDALPSGGSWEIARVLTPEMRSKEYVSPEQVAWGAAFDSVTEEYSGYELVGIFRLHDSWFSLQGIAITPWQESVKIGRAHV